MTESLNIEYFTNTDYVFYHQELKTKEIMITNDSSGFDSVNSI